MKGKQEGKQTNSKKNLNISEKDKKLKVGIGEKRGKNKKLEMAIK